MKKEIISGWLNYKKELKEVMIKDNGVERVGYTIDFGINQNGAIKYITAWDDVAKEVAETEKNSLVLAACHKREISLSKEVKNKSGEKILDRQGNTIKQTNEKITCQKFETDKTRVNELQRQFNALVNDFTTGRIDDLYKVPDKEKENSLLGDNDKNKDNKVPEEAKDISKEDIEI